MPILLPARGPYYGVCVSRLVQRDLVVCICYGAIMVAVCSGRIKTLNSRTYGNYFEYAFDGRIKAGKLLCAPTSPL